MVRWIEMIQKDVNTICHISSRINMATQAPRPRGKAEKIAFALIGKPANFKKKSAKEKELDKILLFQETARVR